ncbi:MAG TPA: SHOCT domain-containing protein [Ktedonobacterales bacterium]
MPGRDFGPGFDPGVAGFGGPGHWWMGLAFMGLSLLFWVGLISLLAWALMRWVLPRLRAMPAMAAMSGGAFQPAQPSAVETLRHRYALGEIDAPTFEQMVERILASEARERQGEQPGAPQDTSIYNT